MQVIQHKKQATSGTQIVLTHLFVGLDLSSDSFSRPILSFNPSFKSGIPERKHFIRIFPVTSQRRTLPVKAFKYSPKNQFNFKKDNGMVSNKTRIFDY